MSSCGVKMAFAIRAFQLPSTSDMFKNFIPFIIAILAMSTLACDEQTPSCVESTYQPRCLGGHAITACRDGKVVKLPCASEYACVAFNEVAECRKYIPCDPDNTPDACADEYNRSYCADGSLVTVYCGEGMHCEDAGVCKANQSEKCGNDTLDSGELCDGLLFAPGKRVCPSGREAPISQITCKSDCTIDTSACVPSTQKCGNGTLDSDEACDGNLFADGKKVCPVGTEGAVDDIKCKATCTVDTSACQPVVKKRALIFSEVTIANGIGDDSGKHYFSLELTNRSDKALSLAGCQLTTAKINPSDHDTQPYAVIESTRTEVANFSDGNLKANNSQVFCSTDLAAKSEMTEICQTTIDFQRDINVFQLVCDDVVIDTFFYSPANEATRFGDLNILRPCSIIEGIQALRDDEGNVVGSLDKWFVNDLVGYAPKYNLGEDCKFKDSSINSCTLTYDTSDENNKHLIATLDIDGMTDITDTTDINTNLFVIAKSSNVDGSTVDVNTIASVVFQQMQPDMNWSDSTGKDRYTLPFDPGTLTLTTDIVIDLFVTRDNGDTWLYCGPKGKIANPAVLVPSERLVFEKP